MVVLAVRLQHSFFRSSASSHLFLPPHSYLCFRHLRAILGSALVPAFNSQRIQSSPNNVISHTGQILHPSAPDEHHAVLLQIVPLARNIRRHFLTGRQSYPRDFPQRRIWFLGCLCSYDQTHPSLLRTRKQCGRFGFLPRLSAPFSHELIYRRHSFFLFSGQNERRL